MSSRDLPKSLSQLATGWAKNVPHEITIHKRQAQLTEEDFQPEDFDKVEKVRVKNLWPAFTSGAGLFSDGYVNASIGSVNTILSRLYPTTYATSNATNNVSSIAFVGTVVGQLSFGYIADNIARKGGLMVANIMLILFTILCAVGTWGAHGSQYGMFAALTAFRFFLGIAIGAEYPTASVIASEFANQLPAGHRNRYFCWFTNSMIDLGFVIAAFVPLVLLWIFSERHLTAVWRLTLGLGVFPPLILFFLRLKLHDSKVYDKLNMKKAKVPYFLIFKFYWFRLLVVSIIWFVYDFSVYSFGTFSSAIISTVVPKVPSADGTLKPDLYKTFGWNTVLNMFYLPGCFLGALSADYFGPRLTIAFGMGFQGIIGFIMASLYGTLNNHIGSFVVVFGIFTALGEFGPGDNIGLLASKTSATPIRGQYYGIAAAVGKIGAFVGTWVFPAITKKYGGPDGTNIMGEKVPFYISSALCLFAAGVALFLCPPVGQDALNKEDSDFVQYLIDNNYDVSQLGTVSYTEEHVTIDENIDNKEATNKAVSISENDSN
jgi:MFS family permease